MKCKICGEECEGNLIIRDANILDEMNCCWECFNLWANQEYDKLEEKISDG